MKFSKLCFGIVALFSYSHLYASNNITFDLNNCDVLMRQCISDETITIHDRIPRMNFMEFLMFARDYKFIKDGVDFNVKLDLYEKYWNNGQYIDSPFEVKRKTIEVEEAYQSVRVNVLQILNGIKTITLKNNKMTYNYEGLFARYDMDREVLSLDGFVISKPTEFSRTKPSDFRFGYPPDFSSVKFSLEDPISNMATLKLPIEQAEKLFYKNKKPFSIWFDEIVFNIESFGLDDAGEGQKGGIKFTSAPPVMGNTLYVSDEDGQVLYIGAPAQIELLR